MNRTIKLALLLLLFSLLLGLIAIFPSVVMMGIIEPVATVLWGVWRVMLSVDQHVYWVGLILLCLTSLFLIIPASASHSAPVGDWKDPVPPTRVERWQALFKEGDSDEDGSAALRESLAGLLRSALDQDGTGAPADWKQELKSGPAGLPPAAREYLFSEAATRKPLLRWTPRWILRRLRRSADAEYKAIDEMLRWMEHEMEIMDDE